MGERIPGPVEHLECCVCGAGCRGRQWWNRDTGYGLCDGCADWLADGRESPEQMKDYYGVAGVHYKVSEVAS